MTNLEWAVIYRPDLFRGFDCPECSKRSDCDQTDGEFDESKCAKGHVEWFFSVFDCLECDSRGGDRCFEPGGCTRGHVEWLMQPRESASEGEGGPVSVSDECEPAESESAAPTDADSREKLEHDIRGSLGFTTKDVFGSTVKQQSRGVKR